MNYLTECYTKQLTHCELELSLKCSQYAGRSTPCNLG